MPLHYKDNMHNYKELKVWQRSMKLAEKIYLISSDLHKNETYGLKSQIRKSAISVPSNIAEGCGRNSEKQLLYFLQVAQGSLAELETQVLLIEMLTSLMIEENLKTEINDIQKMLRGLQRKFNDKKSNV